MMAAAIKSSQVNTPKGYEGMIVESLGHSAARLEQMEFEFDSPEFDLLIQACRIPYHVQLTPTILNLIWEITQVLLAQEG